MRKAFHRRAAVAILAASVLAGCSQAPEGPPKLSASDIADTSDFQRSIVEDNEVTWAEYERATIAERDCLIAEGYSPGELERSGSQLGFVTDVDYSQEADPEAADRKFLAIAKGCEDEYTSLVRVVWGEHLVVYEPEERQRLLEQVVTCLQNAGIDLSADADLDEVVNTIGGLDDQGQQAATPCIEANDRLFHQSAFDS